MSGIATISRPLPLSLKVAAGLVALAALIVPVGSLAAELDLPVPAAVVYPGQSVADRGVAYKAFIVKDEKLPLYVIEDEILVGQVARRTLLPGKPILLSDLKTPDLVRAGASVTMVFREGGLIITGLGTALRSAAEGEIVRVRNADSGIVVSGIVEADGSVRIHG
ncbi:flagellar basal body P-ring formation chaperone FlgA [Aurantimonas marianensis]|uniref:Flagella basal body P-ring formation protein FlgA n=1 Tax=Aurantimonas marianensis TaxID=2920428 RepID=A0A9X2HCH2_9HYPH|nr:flagellar basal body P-ring formation chaperone FlgA [Aurantimonas marianensis]MCP3055952.1 flagellar basal body P-ring formation chaperone FlgA [Aurantimonas marianensis]